MNPILLNPGPANVSERVRKALIMPDTCHREKDFIDLLARVRNKLVHIAGGNYSYSSVILTGSGTAAVEAMVNTVRGGLYVLNNGVYGQRITDIANVTATDHYHYKLPWGDTFLHQDVQDRINMGNFRPKTMAMVHHDTSTGVLNPLNEIGALAKNNKMELIVDAVSSLGGETLNVVEDNVGMLACTANKCFQGFPGISFVIGKKKLFEEASPLCYYLNLKKQYQKQEEGETPFTPAIQILNAMDIAIDELLEEKLKNRIQRYKTMSNIIRDCVIDLGLELRIPRELMGNTVTSINLPEGKTYKEIHARLKKRGYIIYAGQAEDFFRICNMGCITPEIIEKFCEEFKEVMK